MMQPTRIVIGFVVIGFALIGAQNISAAPILNAKNLNNHEKDYLFALVDLLKDLPARIAEISPTANASSGNQLPKSYTVWRKRFDSLKVPSRFSNFQRALGTAIDHQTLEHQNKQLSEKGLPLSSDLYKAAYGKFKEAYSSPDPDVLGEIHDALYGVSGPSICVGGPCW